MSDPTRAEQLRDRIKYRMHDSRYGDENYADLDELLELTHTPGEQAERWQALHGFLEESCRLVIDRKATMNKLGDRIEFVMTPKDTIHVGEEDDRGRSKVVVCCDGVSYEGRVFRGGKMVSFATDVPERVCSIVAEYFREPIGEMNWELLA